MHWHLSAHFSLSFPLANSFEFLFSFPIFLYYFPLCSLDVPFTFAFTMVKRVALSTWEHKPRCVEKQLSRAEERTNVRTNASARMNTSECVKWIVWLNIQLFECACVLICMHPSQTISSLHHVFDSYYFSVSLSLSLALPLSLALHRLYSAA